MRTIDADALIGELHTQFFYDGRDRTRICAKIQDQLTIEPQRKTGKWVKHQGDWFTPGGDMVWECSECGKGVHVYGTEYGTYGADVSDGQWKACPNCTALMGE